MLTSLNRLIGMPVVWQDRQVGLVEYAAADAENSCLGGLLMRKGIGGARWSPREDILLAGEHCVMLRARPGRMPEKAFPSFDRAFLFTGECVGDVTDAFIQGETLRILALEISPGPIYRLLGRCAYAPGYRMAAGGVRVPLLLDWRQFTNWLKEECM